MARVRTDIHAVYARIPPPSHRFLGEASGKVGLNCNATNGADASIPAPVWKLGAGATVYCAAEPAHAPCTRFLGPQRDYPGGDEVMQLTSAVEIVTRLPPMWS